jgi:carbon monoxide dehydrogenase subunit G
MEITGERRLPAPAEIVWRGLSDPETLRRCFPVCRTLERKTGNTYSIAGVLDHQGTTIPFTGQINVMEASAPASCRIQISGEAEGAGAAQGPATITLHNAGAFTLLHYTLTAELSGEIAQGEAAVINASAQRMADRFLENFAAAVAQPEPLAADGPAAAIASVPTRLRFPVPATVLGFPILAWAAAAIFAFIVFNLFASS